MKTSSKTIFSVMAISAMMLAVTPQRWAQSRASVAPAAPTSTSQTHRRVAETPVKPDLPGSTPTAPVPTGGGEMNTPVPTSPPEGGITPPLPPSTTDGTKPMTSETGETLSVVASKTDNLKTLSAAIKEAGLEKKLSEKGPFTLFAPTDEAFNALPAGTVEMLLKPENKEKLLQLLSYHVVEGKVEAKTLKSGDTPTLLGKPITVKVEGTQATVNDAKVIQADVPASNGVIHLIDKVIIPSS